MVRTNIIGIASITLGGLLLTTALILGAQADSRVADAAMIGDLDTVRTLLRSAADVNSAQGDGMTALHWAAVAGDAEMTELLLYAGANVRATTRLGAFTPLFLAAKSGHASIIEPLLDAGANTESAGVGGVTPLMVAASSGEVDAVQLLIDAGADVNAAETGRGQTPLIFAAAFDRSDVIDLLVENGADINKTSNLVEPMERPTRGGPPVVQGQRGSRAGQSGQRGGAPAAARGNRGRRGQTEPTQLAANLNDETPPPDEPEKKNDEPELSTEKGGNPKGRLTPLMYAARDGKANAVRALIEGGANLDAVNGDDSTALLLASINGNFDIAKLLVEAGADVNMASIDGAAPLFAIVNIQWARKTFHPQPTTKYEGTPYLELMTLLLEKGADPNARLQKDLWYMEFDFNLERTNASGITPFWKAAAVGDVDAMRLLVARGADPTISSIEGITPLLTAAGAGFHGNDEITTPMGRLPAVQYLIEELGADVNEADTGPPPNPNAQPGRGRGPQGGFTALHNAAARGDNDMILYLVSQGAPLTAVSKNGSTIVDMANGPRQRVQPYPETVALLEMLGAKSRYRCVSC